ncbi:MAG: DNA polymerase III [Treponema sp.]|nr:DNA polymerase III [Treponema sp.]
MTDKVFHQNSFELMKSDIECGKFPGAVLLSGPEFSGKFTAALEIARILSCIGDRSENCSCEFCRQHRTLSNMNVLVAGPRDCMLEILAMRDSVLQGFAPIAFVRAVHKLTSRFNQILWEESGNSSKFSPVIESIEDELSKFDSAVLDSAKAEKICDSVVKDCQKLESFMYSSLPIDQVRGASAWLRIRSSGGKKVFIIENAERMLDAPKNALLKILEEPPTDAAFILTTSKRGAMMQTILSRVRIYPFCERSEIQQKEIVGEVFHQNRFTTVSDCLYSFLPKTPSEVRSVAVKYYDAIRKGQIPGVDSVVKGCASFEPKILFKSFLTGVEEACGDFASSSATASLAKMNLDSIRECYNNVTVYNQSVPAAIERLTRDLAMNVRLFQVPRI